MGPRSHLLIVPAVATYRLTVRNGPRVERLKFDDVDAALAELEGRARELAGAAHGRPVGGKLMRRLEPAQLVVGRLEISGRGLRASVDVRGDGSTEAYTGRVRRTLIEQGAGESPYDALRRAVGGGENPSRP